MGGEYPSLEELAQRISNDANNQTLLVYAGNSVGKTTLSRYISSIKEETCLCFNTFIEEALVWNNDFENDGFSLTIGQYDPLINKAIVEQGLENRISKIFQSLIGTKVEPKFETAEDKVSRITFSLATGDNASVDEIKISKGEESLFAWSIFYALAEMILDEKCDNDQADNGINYIIIDDPITSLGEESILSVALGIKELILGKVPKVRQNSNNNQFGILITTHSRLLYNILFSELKYKKKNQNCFRLYKSESGFSLCGQNDSPFGYHLEEIKIIKNIIDTNGKIEKIHFNMFRNILEKTASFLGYDGEILGCCLNDGIEGKEGFIRLLNLHSHSRIIDLDDKRIENPQEEELFKTFFNQFLEDYGWNIK